MRVAAELGRTLDFAKIPKREKAEVLVAHKDQARQAISRPADAAEGSCVPDQTIVPVKVERDGQLRAETNVRGSRIANVKRPDPPRPTRSRNATMQAVDPKRTISALAR